MLKTEDAQGDGKGGKGKKSRQRTSTSCTECKRRKQKCNQMRDRPCHNCARRYPPVECIYVDAKTVPQKQRLESEEMQMMDPALSNAARYDLSPVKTNIPLYDTTGFGLLDPASAFNSGIENRRLSSAGSAYSDRSRSEGTPDQESMLASGDVSYLFPVDSSSPPYQFETHLRDPSSPGLSMQVGDSAFQNLHSVPIERSYRNAELFHFFLQRLCPYVSAIDGSNPPPSFMREWLPFLVQSPLVAPIAVLSAAYFQATAKRMDVDNAIDAVTHKVKLISLINEHLTSNTKGVDDQAIAAVMSLAYNELVYADQRSTVAHMRGIRDMVRTRGGISCLSLPFLRMMLMRTDYQVACTYECHPIVQGPQEVVRSIGEYPVQLDSPFLLSDTRFVDYMDILGLSQPAATILDDMRFITTSLLSLGDAQEPEQANAKFLVTVQWIQNRLASPESDPGLASDMIYQVCRATSTIYMTAILSRSPLSTACTAQLFSGVWMRMWQVPLPRWKQIPGVFFFILLVVNPFTCIRPEGRFIKGMFAASVMGIGLVDWNVAAAILKTFLGVQKWLGTREAGDNEGSNSEDQLAVSRAPEGGLPTWSLTSEN
ncbi:hypothetical protein BJ875DRAFT_464418 [Amylocarpus encephaloides]|uniref:Zn(2)-C6 fungal-type domain-containing protein n=1 Tax=Amylocarpus encephaloides TaxID=45428 RepID=A0A9P7YHZ5_9HELO|nr:hypothetical protein BJ875DRAFT_464418 [Amylocarpus encephaloides]